MTTSWAIDRICKVPLGGFPQKIHVRGRRTDAPILLFLHGGPGVSNRHSIIKYFSDLADDFIIVTWDQRGTAGSYAGIDPTTLTVDRLVEDARELVEWLCEQYGAERLFIQGGSWGTQLGTLLAVRHPERIAAYVGSGQVVNGIENEEVSYEFTLNAAVAAGDSKSVAILERFGPPVKGQYREGFKGLMAQRNVLARYGGSSMNRQSYFRGLVIPVLFGGEYSLGDIWGYIKGYRLVLSTMWPLLTDYDFIEQASAFEMPYFIFQGRYDQNTSSELVEAYFEAIKAPHKELIWFEDSAHDSMRRESDKYKALLRQKLLPLR
jgi:pimeloyl-ACP methyl ester carboxylesterase